MRIAVDAMGGDHAPHVIVAGSARAAREWPDTGFILVGDQDAIKAELAANDGAGLENISIVHTTEVMEMSDAPVVAVRGKRKSSVTLSAKLVAGGKAEAMFSAGNTGATVAAATVLLKQLGEIKRSGIAVSFPTSKGTTTLIDVGANIHCTPLHLLQYGVMASVYTEYILGIENPRVGILNIGAEDKKGNPLVRETAQLLEKHPRINFIGNVEGYDIHSGLCDVAICEGFVGNVILKVVEGLSASLIGDVQRAFEVAFPEDDIHSEVLKDIKNANDRAEYGGAPLLGVDGICIIGHGSSDARAVYNALRVARGFEGNKVNAHIAEAVSSDC